MFLDSANIYSTPQLFFSAHRDTIVKAGIRSCKIFCFKGAIKSDSVLTKTIWFDTLGNIVRTAAGIDIN
jgi:hypothetical protein